MLKHKIGAEVAHHLEKGTARHAEKREGTRQGDGEQTENSCTAVYPPIVTKEREERRSQPGREKATKGKEHETGDGWNNVVRRGTGGFARIGEEGGGLERPPHGKKKTQGGEAKPA